MGQLLVFSAKNLNATQAAEPFYSVYKELHSDPGKITLNNGYFMAGWAISRAIM